MCSVVTESRMDGEFDGVARANSPMRVEREPARPISMPLDFGDDGCACFQYRLFRRRYGGDGVYIASSEKAERLGETQGVRRFAGRHRA